MRCLCKWSSPSQVTLTQLMAWAHAQQLNPLHTESCGHCEGGLPNSVTVLLHHHNPYLAQSSFTKQSHNQNSFFPPHKSICFMPKQPNPCLALTAHKQTHNTLIDRNFLKPHKHLGRMQGTNASNQELVRIKMQTCVQG